MSGELLKQLGLDLVSEHNPDFLTLARAEAIRRCRQHGEVAADELRVWADNHGIQPKHPNAWGAVFRSGFRPVGYRKSETSSAHARTIRVWGLA